mgnify:CR=1 FL=1
MVIVQNDSYGLFRVSHSYNPPQIHSPTYVQARRVGWLFALESYSAGFFMTFQELLKSGEARLSAAGISDPGPDAWFLLEYAAKLDRNAYYMRMNEGAPQEVSADFECAVSKRCERVPLQYITGVQGFMGLTLNVNSSVLIPRPETESVVECALSVISPGYRVLDMCTGSGAIAISLYRNQPGIEVVAADVSKAAVLLAKENAKKYDAKIEFITGNLFDRVTGVFDCIVSNPPYIVEAEIPGLMPEVSLFEPIEALNGGPDGLDFYRRIAKEAPAFMREGAHLVLETGCDQGESVSSILRKNGFVGVEVRQDLSGRDRIVMAIR